MVDLSSSLCQFTRWYPYDRGRNTAAVAALCEVGARVTPEVPFLESTDGIRSGSLGVLAVEPGEMEVSGTQNHPKSSKIGGFPKSWGYPLVNIHKTMERSTFFLMGKSMINGHFQ